jgi:oligopeptidase B
MKLLFYVILWCFLFVPRCQLTVTAQEALQAPVAEQKPTLLTTHEKDRVDEYFWMRERENPQVVAYLNAENAYMKAQLAPTEGLQAQLFEEMKARIKQDDSSAPFPDRGYVYYYRTEEGKQYTVDCRRKLEGSDGTTGPEQILLDENKLAEGHEFLDVSDLDVSSDSKLLAMGIDFVGRRMYSLRILNLETGQWLPDQVENMTGNFVWAEDNKTLFYTRQDPETLRSYQVFRHEIGTDPANDAIVFQEDDEEFSCDVGKTRSRNYVLIVSSQTLSSEVLYVDAHNPHQQPRVIQPREPNHEYSIDQYGDYFYVLTNWDARNFRLMRTPIAATGKSNWQEVVPHDEDVLLEGFELFDKYLVLEQRRDALTRLRIVPWDSTLPPHELDFGEPCYVASTAVIPDPETPWLRYRFSSLKTPPSVIEYNMETRQKRIVKEDEILGGFDKNNYRTERQWATARDGTQIPVSILYHKDTAIDGTAPCLEYGYGSYGYSMDASFDPAIFNLVNRKFVYAIAHVRGGQEMGRRWYEDGKLLNKKNTFTDFIDVGDFLVANKYANPKKLYARGGSAGGLLIGAVVNMRPALYDGVIADVPFVDVVTTMLDDSIPLTTGEYDEWGNPNDLEYFNYMLSYSPYDNVQAVAYPNMLVTTGLHDSQVQYWEPAKWVARLRERKTDHNLLLLRTNMDAGHGGASGRYDRYKETALRQAFLLFLANRQALK